MVDRCPPVEALPEIALLPLGGEGEDPRRRHLADCPRCQARLADYRDFMAAAVPCPPRALNAAMAALDATLRAAGDGEALRLAPVPGRRLAFMHPLARTAYALAALFLLLVALDALPDRPRPREIHLRAGEVGPGASVLVLELPRLLPDGSLELSWRAVPGADDYRLHLLAPDLQRMDMRSSGGATQLRLTAAELVQLRAASAVLVWQVEARAGGDPLVVSAPATFPLRSRP